MTSAEKFEIAFDKLALEPMHENATSGSSSSSPGAGSAPGVPAKFHADSRSGKERRLLADRRQELRFQAEHRSGLDRRPKKTWEPGSNL